MKLSAAGTFVDGTISVLELDVAACSDAIK
jgi:hypothetical protein